MGSEYVLRYDLRRLDIPGHEVVDLVAVPIDLSDRCVSLTGDVTSQDRKPIDLVETGKYTGGN